MQILYCNCNFPHSYFPFEKHRVAIFQTKIYFVDMLGLPTSFGDIWGWGEGLRFNLVVCTTDIKCLA